MRAHRPSLRRGRYRRAARVSDFDWGVIARSWPFLAEGMALSALLVAVATAGGLVLGFGLALMRRSRHALIAAPATAYVTVMRTVPLILVLFWFYFLVPLVIGRPVGSLASALIAFVLFEAAFYCEIIRSAIGSVRAGQTEAALATGMKRWQVMRYIVLPQGLKAMTPLLLNQIIIVFQDTSLVYVVALRDFMTTASVVASRDGRPTEMYTLVAVVYLAICFSLSKAVEHYGKARATMIVLENVSKSYGRTAGPARLQRDRPPRRGGRRLRPVGIGQEHADQVHQRSRTDRSRHDHRRRRLGHRPAHRPAGAAHPHRHGVPELRALSAHDGAAERQPGADPRPEALARRGRRALRAAARARRPGRASWRAAPTSSPAASSSASRSRARWRWTRRRCCSTSRPRRSTPR